MVLSASIANPMDQYKSKHLSGISKNLNTHYTGPLCATGGAIADMNKYIERMEPTKIGTVTTNSFAIIDSTILTYTFKRVITYKVKEDSTTFYVYYMKAYMNGEQYEITIELRGNDYYDRILRIYKDDKPQTLILWIETLRVKQKKDSSI